MKLDILVFAAHPDDAELGCGGTIIKHVDLGYKVGVIDLTQGELGSRGDVVTRMEEAKKASELMGISIRENMGFDDGWFEDNKEHRLKIIRKIRQYQPEIILAPAIADRHPDHGRSGKLVAEAAWLSGLGKIETFGDNEVPQQSWRPNHTYHYIQYLPLTPDFVVDIKGCRDRKMETLKAFGTQFHDLKKNDSNTLISSPHFLDLIQAKHFSAGNYALIEEAEGFTSAFKPAVKNLFDLI